MYQIDNSTAVAVIPASTAAGTAGFFTDGNPATGVPATIMPAEYQNMLMMEIINVLAAAGITPSKSNFTQLLSAIKAVNRQGIILTDTGVANAYTAVNAPVLSALPSTGYSQRLNIAHANTGASTYAPDGLAAKPIYGLGLQPLQGGELPIGVAVLMYLVQAGVNGGNGAWIIIESLGGASQVAPATQSQHAVQFSQVLALGQTAQNLTASRALSTTYTNTTGKPIFVSVIGSVLAAGAALIISVNGVGFYGTSCSTIGSQFGSAASVIVPPGGTYSASISTGGNGPLINWTELR